jgi:hypothetical protein
MDHRSGEGEPSSPADTPKPTALQCGSLRHRIAQVFSDGASSGSPMIMRAMTFAKKASPITTLPPPREQTPDGKQYEPAGHSFVTPAAHRHVARSGALSLIGHAVDRAPPPHAQHKLAAMKSTVSAMPQLSGCA